MHKIDSSGNNEGQFVGRNVVTGASGTSISSDWLNAVQTELVTVISDAGIVLDKTKNNQLSEAITKIIETKVNEVTENALTEAQVVVLIKKHAMVWE